MNLLKNYFTVKQKPRVRFAPSPTGYLHIGSLRTALYNFLYARMCRGEYYLRIDDTDQKRIMQGAIQNLMKSLEWAGITHNEGVFAAADGKIFEKGKYGPYIQSKRLEIYQKYAHELVKKGKAYYCFCSPGRLEKLREEQKASKLAPSYDKYCLREVPRQIAEKRIKKGEEFVIRFDVPETGETDFEDAVRGRISFVNKNLDDFIILKSDGYPTYHLAHVVDDHLMKTTLVLRGEEWLSSTPKHVLLFQAFGWDPPEYGHLCVILNKDTKRKLSKRDGDVSVEDFMKKGYLPEAVVNFIALLGWNPKTEQELFTMDELIDEFDIAKLNKSGAIFDTEKLDWLNGIYIRKYDVDDLSNLCRSYLTKYENQFSDEYLKKIVTIERERMKKLSDIGENTDFYFNSPEYDRKILFWKEMSEKGLRVSLEKSQDILTNISEISWEVEKIKNKLMAAADPKRRGELFWPLRVALTGAEKSPSPWEIAWVIGKIESIKRIKKAIDLVEN